MKRLALWAAVALTASVLLWPAAADAASPSASIIPGSCAQPYFQYTLTNSSSGDNFTFDDGSDYSGSRANYVYNLQPNNSPYTDYWIPPSAVTEPQSADVYELTITATGMSPVNASFDYRTCFTYLSRDDFESPSGSKASFIGNSHVGTSLTTQANRIRLYRAVVPPGAGNAVGCAAYLDRTNSGSGFGANCLVYDDNNGVPGNLVGDVNLSTNLAQSSPNWYPNVAGVPAPASFASPLALTPGDQYWIGVYTQKQSVVYRDENGANTSQAVRGDCLVATPCTYPPATWGSSGVTSTGTDSREYAVYLTYTDSGSLITNGNDNLGSSPQVNSGADRAPQVGADWTGIGRGGVRGHAWYQEDIHATEGTARYIANDEGIGFATTTGQADAYTVSALIQLSGSAAPVPAAAPGVTVNFGSYESNVFFKIERTIEHAHVHADPTHASDYPSYDNADDHENGALIGGITDPTDSVKSGNASACAQNDLGLTADTMYWISVEKQGDIITALLYENRATYGYTLHSEPIGVCVINLDAHREANDPDQTCLVRGDDSTSGMGALNCDTKVYYLSNAEYSAIDAATGVGLRTKYQVEEDKNVGTGPGGTVTGYKDVTEDDADSKVLAFYAFDTFACTQ